MEYLAEQYSGDTVGMQGLEYHEFGNLSKAISQCEQALGIACLIGDNYRTGVWLGTLGLVYHHLGKMDKAILYHEQALCKAREIDGKFEEGRHLGNLGHAFTVVGSYERGCAMLGQSLEIADKISHSRMNNFIGTFMAEANLLHGDISSALQAIEVARQHDGLDNNHNAAVMHGVIELQVGKTISAQAAFTEAIAFADALLKQPPSAYDVRYARALAQAGLALITNAALDSARADYEAALAQCAARGVVQRNLRLLEQLALTQDGERLEPLLGLLREDAE